MDPYTTPNIFNQGGTAWENASREEKLQMLDEANMQDSSWTWEYEDYKFDCDGFSRVKLVNMSGCEDFENWNYYYIAYPLSCQ